MLKVRVVRSHCLGAGVDVFKGEVIDLEEREAERKLQLGWVQLLPATPVALAGASHSVESAAPEVPTELERPSELEESTDPAPAAGRRRR